MNDIYKYIIELSDGGADVGKKIKIEQEYRCELYKCEQKIPGGFFQILFVPNSWKKVGNAQSKHSPKECALGCKETAKTEVLV